MKESLSGIVTITYVGTRYGTEGLLEEPEIERKDGPGGLRNVPARRLI